MDVNDDFRLEEELSGSEGGRESAGGASSDTRQETATKQTRKRRREPTIKIEEKKKTGPKGKAGERPAGWILWGALLQSAPLSLSTRSSSNSHSLSDCGVSLTHAH